MFRWLYFPKKLFLNVWLLFWLVSSMLFVMTAILNLSPVLTFLVFSVLSCLVGLVFAYRFSRPLQRVIIKTLRLVSRKQFGENSLTDEDILEEEPGEYAELEHALEKVRMKMNRRKQQLIHEKEQSQALLGALHEAVCNFNLQGELQFSNSKFNALFFKTSQRPESLRIQHIFREPEIGDLFEKVLEQKDTLQRTIRLSSAVDNTQRFFNMTMMPLFEKHKQNEIPSGLYSVMAVFHDINDIKTAEQIRIEFFQNASHELRTPLTSIKGYVETLREDVKAQRFENSKTFLDVISRNVDRLNDLVADMMELSKLDTHGCLKKEMVEIADINALMQEAFLQRSLEKKIHLHFQSQISEVSADPGKLDQVLRNLIDNAIKYNTEGREVMVSWSQNDEEVVLSVKDNGPGIPADALPRVFERFYRVDQGRSRDVGGTGLGLAIVKHIMQLHGGYVRVKSVLGQGSEFLCHFPVVK